MWGFCLSILTTYIHYVYNNAYISVDRGVFRKQYMMTLCVWTRMMYPHCGPHRRSTHTVQHTQKETLVLKQRLSWWTVKSLSEMSRGNHPRFAECGWTKLFKLLSAVGRLDSSFLICSHSSSLLLARSLSLSHSWRAWISSSLSEGLLWLESNTEICFSFIYLCKWSSVAVLTASVLVYLCATITFVT